MAIRFVQITGTESDARRVTEVQRIFREYFGAVYTEYADRIPELLDGQAELGHRTILIGAEDARGRMRGFALALHYTDLNVTLLDYIVIDPSARQRGIGGALYEALREYLGRFGSRGIYLEVRPDDPVLESDPARRKENRARIRFYERYGARVIQGTAYEQTRPGRAEGEPYLMYDGLGEARRPNADEVRGIISAILFRKYRYPRDDEYAKGIVASVRDDTLALQKPRTSTAPDKVGPEHGIFRPLKVVVTRHHEIHHIRERGYVERPVRVEKIVHALKAVQDVEFVGVTDHGESPITAVHDHDFVDYLSRVCPRLGEKETVYPYVFPIRLRERKPLDEEVQAGYYCIDTFTPLTRNAYAAARASVDCALTGVDLVLAGEHLVYSLCRPPGHHAERRVYGGFCYFNNAAIAANVLSASGRVAVLDVDFHHGNGTQDIFYDRADVLTISVHGDPSYAYPYFAGFEDERGNGPGEGFNYNFPLAEGIGDDEYLETLGRALEIVERFGPRYFVVSLGLDIAKGDPTGAWTISPQGLERIGGALAGLGLPTLAVQEGGYDTRVLGRNAVHLLRGLQRGIYERRLAPRA